MSACKTGCGSTVVVGRLCDECIKEWLISPEYCRFDNAPPGPQADVALTDFCNRIRAERSVRNNEVLT